MNIPNYPTDSLYKFLAIAGASLCIITFYVYDNMTLRYNENAIKYNTEISVLKHGRETLEGELNYIKYKVRKICALCNCNCFDKKGNIVLLPDFTDPKDKELVSRRREIDSLFFRYHEKHHALNYKAIELSGKWELINSEQTSFESVTIFYYIFNILGLASAIIGFILWHTRIQIYQDEVLKKEALKYRNDNFKEMD